MRRAITFLAAAGVVVALGMMFFYAPTEANQGEMQRMFYLHVPSAWLAYLAFILVAAASILVLARGNDWARWDRVGSAAAEIGLLFTTVVLTTGPIWAHREWGVWWSWDARLTSTLVLWLIYAGYLLYRSVNPPGERRARTSAVIGIVGAIDIPVVHFAVTWWTSAHPDATVLRSGGPDLPTEMFVTLLVSFGALLLLATAMLLARISIEEDRTKIAEAAELARV